MSTPSISSASGEILINNGDIRITDATAVFKCSAAGLVFSDNSTLTTAPGGAQNLQGVVDTGNVCTEVVSLTNSTLSLSTGGPVGVGTASPSSVLSVVGTSPYSSSPSTEGIHLGQTAASAFAAIEMVSTDNKCFIDFTKPGQDYFYRLVSNLSSRDNLEIYGPGGIALSVEKDNSYVGIGTDTPTETLDVAGNIKVSGHLETTNGRLLVNSTGSEGGQINVYDASGGAGFWAIDNDALGNFRVFRNGGGTALFCDTTGKVRVGDNSTPTEVLDVIGNIKASGGFKMGNGYLRYDSSGGANRWYTDSGENLLVQGSIEGTSYITTPSDDRLKHNEVELSNAIDIVNKLTVYRYDKTFELLDADYNGDLSNHEHFTEIGVIAQDVQNIPELAFTVNKIPDLVETNSEGEQVTTEMPYSLVYNNLHNLGLKAIQELSAENTTLKSQVTDLLARVQALENA